MADQKSRGGQKQAHEREPESKKNRDVRAGADTGQYGQRDMAEDARRGQQGNQGGHNAPNRRDKDE